MAEGFRSTAEGSAGAFEYLALCQTRYLMAPQHASGEHEGGGEHSIIKLI